MLKRETIVGEKKISEIERLKLSQGPRAYVYAIRISSVALIFFLGETGLTRAEGAGLEGSNRRPRKKFYTSVCRVGAQPDTQESLKLLPANIFSRQLYLSFFGVEWDRITVEMEKSGQIRFSLTQSGFEVSQTFSLGSENEWPTP